MSSMLKGKTVILASSSPRRREILQHQNIEFKVVPSTFEENLTKEQTPHQYVENTAYEKAKDVVTKLTIEKQNFDVLVSADTVVSMDNKIIEKARDKQHARSMLESYENKRQSVLTGVVIVYPLLKGDGDFTVDGKEYGVKKFVEESTVEFGTIDKTSLDSYLDNEDAWTNKAGGYGYQDFAREFVRRMEGCFYNVVGFPYYSFISVIKQLKQEKLI